MAFFQCKYAFSNENMTFYINKRRRKTPYTAFSMQIRLFICLSEGVGCRQYVLNFKLFCIIYMVQYASFGNFYSNYGNFQNFDFALILIVMHHTSSYISINSRNTLGNYRMRSFLLGFSRFSDFFHSF